MQDHSNRRDAGGFTSEGGETNRERRQNDDGPGGNLGVAVIGTVVSILDRQPVVLMRRQQEGNGRVSLSLPSCGFEPVRHDTLEAALRDGVQGAGGPDIGYLEQLAADCGLHSVGAGEQRSLSIGYLALIRQDAIAPQQRPNWVQLYTLLPWEDWRKGRPACLTDDLLPRLEAWAGRESECVDATQSAAARVRIAFGQNGSGWDDELVVERLDLLIDAGLIEASEAGSVDLQHLRIVASALGRLRSKIRYRPVVFELLPAEFTLFELQRAVEAILGPNLHKQNFRRLVEGMGLVEPTGEVKSHTGGRPARLFRFRPQVMMERAAPGVRIRPGKAA